ncbi:MAG: hypothetical protein MUO77_18635, partial [Anaerolineales bacterium]|nr:hypothetical protein [Anaerolineales bacterium]
QNLRPLLLITALEGAATILFLLLSPSKEQGILWGYSATRLGMAALTFLGLCLNLALIPWGLKNEQKIINRLIASSKMISSAAMIMLVIFIALIVIVVRDDWNHLGNIGSYIARGAPLLVWFALLIVQLQVWMMLQGIASKWEIELLASFLLVTSVIVFIFFDIVLRGNGINLVEFRKFAQVKLTPNLPWVFLFIIIAFAFGELGQRSDRKYFILAARALSIFIAAWFIYQFTGFIGRWFFRAPEQAYFPYLADAFLHGKLYLINPLSYMELTPNNGNWYVPYPPLNAVLMMPMVALWGAENVNSSNFSIFFAALSVSLVFAILEKLSERGWTKLNASTNLWLTVLFGLSTPLWQIAISGEVWYINQVITIAFVALATLLVLLEASPILVGFTIGLAMLARPPILLSWIFLLGIFWQIQNDRDGQVPFAKWFKWSFLTAIPVLLIGFIFLWYNYSRFGSLFDFGYAAMNIGEPARTDIRTYGQFNLRYLSRNLDVMFLRLPHPKPTCGFFTADTEGMSLFVATPAFIYLLGAFKRKAWVSAAWISSILLFIPLALYFTTGIFQFGYRYVLDMIIPLVTLLAVSVRKEKLALHMKAIILAGVLVNYWGVWWFYRHWCR